LKPPHTATQPLAASATTPFPRLLLGFAVLLGGRSHISLPPQAEIFTLRTGVAHDFQNLEVRTKENSGPHPAIDGILSVIADLEGTTATAVEFGGNVGLLAPGGDIDGDYWRVLIGGRRTWHMDSPLRPNFGMGAAWSTYDQREENSDFDIKGPSVYVSGGVEYYWTPKLGIGVDLRSYLQYLQSHKERDFTSAGQIAVHLLYRF